MRPGFTALMVLFQSLAACSGPGVLSLAPATPANVSGAAPIQRATTETPSRAPTVGAPAYPAIPVAVPSPQGATATSDIPPEVVSFVDTQLKGRPRLGPAEAWVVRMPRDTLIESYRQVLTRYGWKQVSDAGGPARSRILVFEMPEARATAVFLSNGDARTRLYVVSTLR